MPIPSLSAFRFISTKFLNSCLPTYLMIYDFPICLAPLTSRILRGSFFRNFSKRLANFLYSISLVSLLIDFLNVTHAKITIKSKQNKAFQELFRVFTCCFQELFRVLHAVFGNYSVKRNSCHSRIQSHDIKYQKQTIVVHFHK